MVFSLATHLLCAWVVNWTYHPDQLFQILEFGGYKSGVINEKDLAWEFAAHLRSAAQPAMVFLVAKICGSPFNPILTTFLLRIIASIIGWFCLTFITLISLNWVMELGAKRFILYCYACLWFLPYIHANFSSESISGSLFFAGLGCAWIAHSRKNNYFLLACGFLIGFAFVFRYQTGFLIAGLLIWCIFFQKFRFDKIMYIFIPAAFAVAIGVLCDHWFYDEWVNTAWNYFKVNIIDGKASSFGVYPWWEYFAWSFIDMIPPVSIIVIAAAIIAIIKSSKNIVIISVVPYLIIHFIIGHKEPRFLFPLVDAVPVFLALSYNHLYDFFEKKRRLSIFLFRFFLVMNVAIIAILLLKPKTDPYSLYEVIHDKYWNSKAVMFCSDDQPYSFNGMQSYFYKPFGFSYFISLNKKNLDSAIIYTYTANRQILVYFDREKDELAFTKNHPEAKQVYSGIPSWMYYFNINNWISRTIKLSLYEMPRRNGCGMR